jgi:hypothetical protein
MSVSRRLTPNVEDEASSETPSLFMTITRKRLYGPRIRCIPFLGSCVPPFALLSFDIPKLTKY